MTTTTLVHRPSSGDCDWWRGAQIYEINAPVIGEVDHGRALGLLDHVQSLGFDGILVRPSLFGQSDPGLADLRRFSEAAHNRGLRVITRLSGALGPVTGRHARDDNRLTAGQEALGPGLIERAEEFIDAGVDGIDLGAIIPPEASQTTDLDLLSRTCAELLMLVSSATSDGILGADVTAEYGDSLHHHLQKDWFHHLRNDRLFLTRWNADSIARHLTASLEEYERFGAPPAWRVMPPYRYRPELEPSDDRRWFVTDRATRLRRGTALQTLMLALPGAIYLRQGDEVGILDDDKDESPLALVEEVNRLAGEQGSLFGSPVATVRHASHLRRERKLSCAPMAFVSGMDWCPDEALTILVRDVLVLANTTDAPISLPEHAEVLLASHELAHADGHLIVPPTTTVWCVADTVA